MTLRSRLLAVAALVALAATLATATAGAATATTRPDLLPDCAYGASARGLTGFESRVQHDAWAYADKQAGASAADGSRPRARSLLPRSATSTGCRWSSCTTRSGVPLPQHDHQHRGADHPESKRVVSPNVDTAYTVGWLSLTQGPLVIDVPDTAGRFYTFQFMDAFTNSFAYVGSGVTGTKAGSYLLAPPGWSGDVPAGVHLLRSPTQHDLAAGPDSGRRRG